MLFCFSANQPMIIVSTFRNTPLCFLWTLFDTSESVWTKLRNLAFKMWLKGRVTWSVRRRFCLFLLRQADPSCMGGQRRRDDQTKRCWFRLRLPSLVKTTACDGSSMTSHKLPIILSIWTIMASQHPSENEKKNLPTYPVHRSLPPSLVFWCSSGDYL